MGFKSTQRHLTPLTSAVSWAEIALRWLHQLVLMIFPRHLQAAD